VFMTENKNDSKKKTKNMIKRNIESSKNNDEYCLEMEFVDDDDPNPCDP